MAGPGRNDPCACGSGKKYKHCHLLEAQPVTGITAADRQAAVAALMKYSTRAEFDDAVATAALMWVGDGPDGDVPAALEEMMSLEPSRDAFFEWLFFDLPLEDPRPIAEHLLSRQAWSLPPRAADYVRIMLATEMRPYQVRESTPGEGLLLRDLWTGSDLSVRERSASRQVVTWDVLACRVHTLPDGSRQLEGSLFPLPPSTARTLSRTLKREFRRLQKAEADLTEHAFFKMVTPVLHLLWLEEVAMAPPPELRTPEGDPYMASTLEFDVPQAGDALARLLEQADFEAGPPGVAAWVEPSQTPTRLLGDVEATHGTLELRTMSKERAVRGRARLEAVLGPLRLRRETHEAPDLSPRHEAPAGPGDDPADGGADPLEPPEVAALLAQHDRDWLDLSIPALDGATPRAAARDRRLRPRLVDLLIDLENRAARVARTGAVRDVTWMWTELGLKRP